MNRLMLRLLGSTAVVATALLAGCERPPVKTDQLGYRGTAMQQTHNPRTLAALEQARPTPPVDVPAIPDDGGPRAGKVYQNVKVLGDLSAADFVRHMNALTQWVSPEEGCGYCHNLANLADDSKYTKVVARRMIEMTRQVNAQWKPHVADTGVTCYTCHRGKPVPEAIWFTAATPKANTQPMLGNDFGQNKAIGGIGLTSLPYDPFTPYFLGKDTIRVYGTQALPQGRGTGASLQTTEQSYALMVHMSQSLGVNCTFCHNSQAFSHWQPTRVKAWHGIQMVRELNNDYVVPLTPTFPANRLGPTQDVAKVYCATCHQGQNKPLGGKQMAGLYAGLQAAAAVQVADAKGAAAGGAKSPAPAKGK